MAECSIAKASTDGPLTPNGQTNRKSTTQAYGKDKNREGKRGKRKDRSEERLNNQVFSSYTIEGHKLSAEAMKSNSYFLLFIVFIELFQAR
jgi:hypothetical protein